MQPVRLCAVDEVPPGEMTRFVIEEKELLLINAGGQFFCLDARCTHAGAPLSEGTVNGDVLTCPWHRSRFKITDGSVINGPAQRPLGAYKVMLKDGQVFVDIGPVAAV